MGQTLDIKKIFSVLALIAGALVLAFLIAKKGILIAIIGALVPLLIIYIASVFKRPQIGLWTAFILNYFVLGITRYLPAPLGLAIDSLLVLTILAIFFQYFYDREVWNKSRTKLTVVAFIWFGYALFQLVNPETLSREAWFYAMRGVALYMVLVIPLTFILFDRYKDFNIYLHLWIVFALLGFIKGMMQKTIGPDPWEQAWLDGGGALTHILFGKLRIFSFFSDAGQYGAAMGHVGIVMLVIAINGRSIKEKIFYGVPAGLFIFGMMTSGTRGAIAVLAAGFVIYLILTKNIRMITIGGIVGLLIIIFFKFTTIGNANYEIRRMRTGFDSDNPSLQTRITNQKKLRTYLSTRPFGGGIGSSGNWGQRFTPNTFLANTPTDSWYVMIWAEQGVIGLYLHLGILFFILIRSSYVIMFRIKDPWLKAKMQGITAGLAGVMAASYGNGVLGQMPTGIILYMGMAFLFLGPKFDLEITKKTTKTKTFYLTIK
ncbi:MAG: O-antigen ligase family protein [Bacteroidales bacterium]|nr:O-antigen ligase family protein [Bacteroidales bacterium]MCF8405609.1 O-antigen ligase family protein [Bacteroidales bacterium]